MKPGQVTVLGLLIVLLALEAVRNKNVLSFLTTWLNGFRTAITGVDTMKKDLGSGTGETVITTPGKQPPAIQSI